MKVSVVGSGYVGLVTGACLADAGNNVWCVDKNVAKIEHLKNAQIPIYEPGLEEIVKKNYAEGRLHFTTELSDALDESEICFIAVDTPPDGDGKADLTNVLAVADEIGRKMNSKKIVITKSTVPVGTTFRVKAVIEGKLQERGMDPKSLISVASNPEFLKEGSAVQDFMKPDRVIVGVENETVGEKLHELYKPFMMKRDRFLRMDIPSSELSKYAANAMLATRISFVNELARLCEKVGANISNVRESLGTDPRIGPEFLYAGLGYGGSCFPKDMKALVQLGREYNVTQSIAETADKTNDQQREWFWQKIENHFGGKGSLKGKKIAVWGVAFKANTDDVRHAPSLDLIAKLRNEGAEVYAFDPVAHATAKTALDKMGVHINWAKTNYDCLGSAHALIICTEWHEFRSPDFEKMKDLMKGHAIFDGRNLYDPKHVREYGFTYASVGR